VALIGFSKYSLLANFLCKKIVIRPHVTPMTEMWVYLLDCASAFT